MTWLDGVRHFSFDKDGTLIDAHHYWTSVVTARAEAIRARLGAAQVDTASLVDAMGIDFNQGRIRPEGPVGYAPRTAVIEAVVSRLRQQHDVQVEAEDVGEIFAAVDSETERRIPQLTVALPNVQETLRELRSRGMALSLVTSDRTALADAALRSSALREYFGAVVGGDRMERQKPDPDGLLQACRLVGVGPEATAYVGDTIGDMKTAKAAGVLAVGVLTGLASRQEIERHADVIVDDLTELCNHS